MKIIALEEHVLTKPVRDALSDPVIAEPDASSAMSRNTPIEATLEEVSAERLHRMDAMGIDVQVLSLTAPGVQTVITEHAVEQARNANDFIARSVAMNSARFDGFATLPLSDPTAAVVELGRATQELGLKGAMIFPRVRGRQVDQPEFLPVFQAASRLRVPIYLHPQTPPQPVRDAYYEGFGDLSYHFATSGVGWHLDAGIQLLRLILAGVFDRCPDLQVIVGHWGEALLFYLERIDRLSSLGTRLERPISDYFRNNVFVTPSGIFSQRYLAWAIDVLGADRVLFAVDDPYIEVPDGQARRFLEEAPIDQAQREAIAHRNWERLIGRTA